MPLCILVKPQQQLVCKEGSSGKVKWRPRWPPPSHSHPTQHTHTHHLGMHLYEESTCGVQIKHNIPPASDASERERGLFITRKRSSQVVRTSSHSTLLHNTAVWLVPLIPRATCLKNVAFSEGLFMRAWWRHLLLMSEELRWSSSQLIKYAALRSVWGGDHDQTGCLFFAVKTRRQVEKADMLEETVECGMDFPTEVTWNSSIFFVFLWWWNT